MVHNGNLNHYNKKTPTAEYLCGTFVNIKSNRVDFSGHFRFWRVGELINWVRFIDLQNILKSSRHWL
jgi:hypothetical protein